MTDERYAFIQDVREKKDVAKSARNRRAHAGKGGAVRFPHDNMTRKERKKLDGELKTYNLDAPMKWEAFKSMPDDLKREYIQGIRGRFNTPPLAALASMLWVHKVTLGKYLRTLGGLSDKTKPYHEWDEKGFNAWAYPEKIPVTPSAIEQERRTLSSNLGPGFVFLGPAQSLELEETEVNKEQTEDRAAHKGPEPQENPAKPNSGCLQFEGPAAASLNTVAALLGEKNVKISIIWSTKD